MKIPPLKPSPIKSVESNAEPTINEKKKQALKEVSRNFEAMFVNQMVSAMRKTIVRDGIMPQSHAEKVYQGMLDTEHAKAIAHSGELGLSDAIYQQLLRDSAQE